MKKRYDLENFLTNVENSLKENEKITEYPSHFYQSFYEGERKYYQDFNVEAKEYDLGWIRTIESYFGSIDNITRNMKSVLKYEEEIIPVEKAKKVTKQSVAFLSANTHLINDITEEGVVPKKILTDQSEIDYGIYENRFIMTLIRRLSFFVSERVKEIRKDKEGFRRSHLNLSSKFKLADSDYEVNVDITQTEVYNKRKVQEQNNMVLERAERLEYLVNQLNNSKFMISMKGKQEVKPPILKTSIITKNPDYKNAYLLWLYLDRHSKLDFQLVKETTKKRFTNEYTQALDRNIMLLTSTLINHDKVDNPDLNTVGKAKYRVIKPKILTVLPGELDVEINPIQIENNVISEYYLNKTKELFKNRLDELSGGDEKKYKISLEQALNETLAVSNALYASFFEVNQDVDIFERLIKEDEPKKELAEAYKKLAIAKIIRHVKEKDFKETINLERKWVEVIKAKQAELLEYERTQSENRLNELTETNKELITANKEKLMNENKAKINKYISEQKKKMENELKQLREELKQVRSELKAKEKLKKQAEKAKLKEKLKQQRLNEAKKLREEKQNYAQKLKKERQQLINDIATAKEKINNLSIEDNTSKDVKVTK